MAFVMKMIGLLLKFQDITNVYCEEKGKFPSIFLSKRMIGTVLAVGFGTLVALGVSLDQVSIDYLTANAVDLIPRMVELGIALYGFVLGIVGIVQRTKRGKPEAVKCNPNSKEDGVKKAAMILFVVSLISMFAVSAWAQSAWPDRSQPQVMKGTMKAGEPTPPPSSFVFSLNNLSGDFGLIFKPGTQGAIAPGLGMDLINYKGGLITLRGQAFFQSQSVLNQPDNAAVVGTALLVNIVQLTSQVPGISWLPKAINPSIGFFGGYDFISGKPAFGPMMSIINIPF